MSSSKKKVSSKQKSIASFFSPKILQKSEEVDPLILKSSLSSKRLNNLEENDGTSCLITGKKLKKSFDDCADLSTIKNKGSAQLTAAQSCVDTLDIKENLQNPNLPYSAVENHQSDVGQDQVPKINSHNSPVDSLYIRDNKKSSNDCNNARSSQGKDRTLISTSPVLKDTTVDPGHSINSNIIDSNNNALLSDQEKYAIRAERMFQFMLPDKIKDANGKRPGQLGYNPHTLFIPPGWFKTEKISEGQRQWWQFKSQHFDSVLLFKMGKFYELFEMDAHIGVEVLGLAYMRGDQPHSGFPEANYHIYAKKLVMSGCRVVVIEQTETPEMLKIRNDQRKKEGKSRVNVVNREVVAILTRGTLTDPSILPDHQEAAYLISVSEYCVGSCNMRPYIGASITDCATGQVLLGSWHDDGNRTILRSHLASLRPVELVYHKSTLSSTTLKILNTFTNARMNDLDEGFEKWEKDDVVSELQSGAYFNAIQTSLQCRVVLSMCKINKLSQISWNVDGNNQYSDFVAMDGAALENLEILSTLDGATKGALISVLDFTLLASGKRKLKDWLAHPLGNVDKIIERQVAITNLMNECHEIVGKVRKTFKVLEIEKGNSSSKVTGLCDLERALAQLNLGGRFGRDSKDVILYEDVGKRKLKAFLKILNGFKIVKDAYQLFLSLASELKSSLLKGLINVNGRFSEFVEALDNIASMADWKAAEEIGRIEPLTGVDASFDLAIVKVAEVDKNLNMYLSEMRKLFATKNVQYVSILRESHVLEVPEANCKNVSSSFDLVSQRKGFRRYTSSELRKLMRLYQEAETEKELAMSSLLQGIVHKFLENLDLWTSVVNSVSELDALMSLAMASNQMSSWGDSCVPEFINVSNSGDQVYEATNLRHPVLDSGSFVPNDVSLSNPNFLVLTGPNMGGKSTIMRQVCLSVILAQVGCHVPAASLKLSPVDAIFVRMGARDSIISGQSTFHMELTETATALINGSKSSLVIIDELGRGTSTMDGISIAAAVLEYLACTIKCRGLFATHYHKLSDMYEANPRIGMVHMSFVTDDENEEKVIFLYKLVHGSCPKSHGMNVARMAGIPAEIIEEAVSVASHMERGIMPWGDFPEDDDCEATAENEDTLADIEKYGLSDIEIEIYKDLQAIADGSKHVTLDEALALQNKAKKFVENNM